MKYDAKCGYSSISIRPAQERAGGYEAQVPCLVDLMRVVSAYLCEARAFFCFASLLLSEDMNRL